MSSHRLFVEQDLSPGQLVQISGERAHYVGKVLRARVGDTLQLFNGDGSEFSAPITGISKSGIELRLGESRQCNVESPLAVRLIQGVSRGDRMDTVVQKATELGVQRLSPLLAEFSVVRLDAERSDKRLRHWRAISHSACEQSGRLRPPQIDRPCRIDDVLAAPAPAHALRLMLVPGAAARLASLDSTPSAVDVLVGPEGGFSRIEEERALAAGFQPVSLGPRILRTETAAISVLTLVQAKWGDLA